MIRRIFFGLAVAAAVAAGGCGGGEATAAAVCRPPVHARATAPLAVFPQTVRALVRAVRRDSNSHRHAVHVLAGELPSEESPPAYWILRAVQADVESDPVTTLPNDFVYTEARGASFFALDNRGNEVSSADEESEGAIRVELEGCDER